MAPFSGMSRMRNPKPSPNMYYPQTEGQPLMPPMSQMRMNHPSYLDDRQMGSPCAYPRMGMGGTPPEFKSPPMMPSMTEPAGPAPKKKRRNAASAAAQPAPPPVQPVMDIMPPPPTGYGDTIVASNPFDDSPAHPPPMMMPPMRSMQPTAPPAMSSPLMSGPMSPMMRSPLQDNMMSGPPNMPMIMSPMGPQTIPNMQPQQQQQQPPPQQQQQQPPPPLFSPMAPKPMPVTTGKVYPPDQPMVFNPQNPNAPPIYPCGICHKEVHDNDQAILCESGCNFWFHRICTGLTEAAFQMLTAEVYAEWVCDKCVNSKNIPLVKCKP